MKKTICIIIIFACVILISIIVIKKLNFNNYIFVKDTHINLSNYSKDIIIKKEGTYTLEGHFENTLYIDSKNNDIQLILDNVTFNANSKPSIVGKDLSSLIISSFEDTNNIFISNGESKESNGIIISNSEILLDGKGTITINGENFIGEGISNKNHDITINSGNIYILSSEDGINSGGKNGNIIINGGNINIMSKGDAIDSNNKIIINNGNLYLKTLIHNGDTALDSDNGININGGELIALSLSNYEIPDNFSSQNTICALINDDILQNDVLYLYNSNNQELLNVYIEKNIKNIIFSSPNLINGNYYFTDNYNFKYTFIINNDKNIYNFTLK